MTERDEIYTFEVSAHLLRTTHPESAMGEFHRALARTAMEAAINGAHGFSVQGVQRDGVGFVRVQVPAQVAADARWLWRRSVL